MSINRKYETYTIALQANQAVTRDIPGNMYSVQSSTGPFSIVFDGNHTVEELTTSQGGEFVDTYTKQKFISPTAQTIKVILGFGRHNDARASVNATVNTTIAPSDTVNNPGDVTAGAAATLAISANANRKEVELCLSSDAQNPVRIGNSSVTANSGSILEPGASKVFAVEAALYVIRTNAPNEIVTVLELERP